MFYTHLINPKKSNHISFKDDINKPKMPIIKNIRSNSVFPNSLKEGNNDQNNLYINIQNNFFTNKNNNKNKIEFKKYNLKNYNKFINLDNKSHLSSYEEQLEENFIKNFFESLKLRTIKREHYKNKTHFQYKKNANSRQYNTDYNKTNPGEIKMFSTSENIHIKTISTIPKKELSYNSEENFKINKIGPLKLYEPNEKKIIKGKIKNNKKNKIVFPNIKILKKKLKNIMSKAEKLNKDLKYSYLNDKEDEQNNVKISLTISNKIPNINIYKEEKNENFLKKQKYFDNYLEKMSSFKYNNKLINKFFKKKEEQISKNNNFILTENNEDEEEILRQNNKESIIQMKILNQIKDLKNNVKSNVDKDIFKVFNKNL